MSYLLQFARRPGSVATRKRRARVDERVALNLPGFYGDAAIRVYVGDTTGRRGDVSPRLKLRISDCTNQINLEFTLASAGERENAFHKLGVLIGSLERFRTGLAAEAALAEQRELD